MYHFVPMHESNTLVRRYFPEPSKMVRGRFTYDASVHTLALSFQPSICLL